MAQARLKMRNIKGIYLLLLGLLLIDTSAAQGIIKIVDDKGVTYFTNEPESNDPSAKPKQLAASASPVSAASSPSALTVAEKSKVNATATQATASSTIKAPINPAQALGDWPPKSLQIKPAP
jgi:hypothetical protein